jgi:class 3 adenylate cyclase/tetratricopeptide (TPR) repeat protein
MTALCPTCLDEAPDGARFCPSCGARLVAERPEATERRVVTTLFADLVGFTALGERHDPEDVDAVLRAYFELARSIIERFGGGVEKFIGDAVVGLFGVHAAHEDDAERAVRAALELVARMRELPTIGEEPLQVRAAVNTGPTLVRLRARPGSGEGVLVGDSVNTAARLLASTEPMTVAAGVATHRLTRRVIDYERLPAVFAKGKADPVERWIARGAVARRGIDSGTPDELPMVGREIELAVLSGLVDRAIASRIPQFALVSGEAGIGKSRLVRELFRLVDARPGVLFNWRQGRCPPYGEGLAYWSLSEIVGAHAGILPGDTPEAVERKLGEVTSSDAAEGWFVNRLRPLVGLPAPHAERDENLTAWTRFFESIAGTRPAVVVIEDLHWASEPTVEFLGHFVRHAAGVPLLLVGTARPEFLEAHPDVYEGVPTVARIDLKALSAQESLRLATELCSAPESGEVAERVADRCGGNPLFAEELARYFTEVGRADESVREVEIAHAAPTTILALIAARLDALPAALKALLADAAVVGQVFWPEAVAAAGGSGLDDVVAAVAQLEQRQFIRPRADSALAGETEFAFWHSLVRDVAYEQLPRTTRALRHVRLAQWLGSQGPDRDDLVEVVAHHYATGLELAEASQDLDFVDEHRVAAREALVRAGDLSLRLDVASAERHYATALETAREGDPSIPGLLVKRSEALRAIGRAEEAIAGQQEAARLYEAAGDVRQQAYALGRLALTLGYARADDGYSLAEKAVRMLDDEASEESIAVLETLATLQLWQGDLSTVLATTRHIVDMAERLELPPSARSLGLHGYARYVLGDAEGLDEMVDAIASAETYGSATELFGIREAYARCVSVVEDPETALAATRQWIAEAQRRRDLDDAARMSAYAARYLLLCGLWSEALTITATLISEGRHDEDSVAEAELLATRVGAHLVRGTLQEATGDASRYQELLPELGNGPWFGNITVAAFAAELGEKTRTMRLLEQIPRAGDFASEPIDVLWWPLAVRTALVVKEPGLAATLAQTALDWPSCPPRVRLTLAALLAEDAADIMTATQDYSAAVTAWRAGKCPHEEGLALLGLARCLLGSRRRTEGIAALDEAHTVLAGIGARPALADVERLRRTA